MKFLTVAAFVALATQALSLSLRTEQHKLWDSQTTTSSSSEQDDYHKLQTVHQQDSPDEQTTDGREAHAQQDTVDELTNGATEAHARATVKTEHKLEDDVDSDDDDSDSDDDSDDQDDESGDNNHKFYDAGMRGMGAFDGYH